MDLRDQRIGLAGYDREGLERCFSLLPALPETGEGQGRAIALADEVGLLVTIELPPLVESVCRDKAAAPPEGLAERRRRRQGLRAGVDGTRADLAILRPVWDQAPTQEGELASAGAPFSLTTGTVWVGATL
jgi:hypothetical protein